MHIYQKLVAAAVAGGLVLGATSCSSGSGGGSGDGEVKSVGISMPTRSLERWINDGEQLQKKLEDAGFQVDLQYADNKTDQQINQIQNMVAGGSDVLVVAAIDGDALNTPLEDAKKQDATVIAYDRLINGTEAVDYYATFDNYNVGQLQGKYIEKELGLADGKGPFNFEPFYGDPGDNNAKFFFSGAWDVLSKYVDNGQLVIPSGKKPKSSTDGTNIGIPLWDSSKAQSEMDNRLTSFYTGGKKVDAILAPNDSLAYGIIQSLKGNGYTPDKDWPILTGQDADKANVQAIEADEQSMTVWKDTRLLGDRVFTMVESLSKGQEPEVNDTKSYDNGKKVVPAYLLKPEVITKKDVQSKLVDSGFMTAEQAGLK